MSLVEQLYQSAIDEMSPKDRVARSVELFNWSREFIGRQIRSENPTASEERLKFLVALRILRKRTEHEGTSRTHAG